MITIVIIPIGIRQKRLSDIYFLGALIERDSLVKEFRGKDDLSRKRGQAVIERMPAMKRDGLALADDPRAGTAPAFKDDHKLSDTGSIMHTEKILPGIASTRHSREIVFLRLDIDGEAGRREVLFKPETESLEYLSDESWSDISDYYTLEIGISIAADGTVLASDIIRASEYPDIDTMLQDYIGAWRFRPLESGQSQDETAEGVISVEFLL
jgi:hypothetical protein